MLNLIRKNIYLDYASATPIDKDIKKKMDSDYEKIFANSNSIHKLGVVSKNKIEESRERIAKLINAHNDEIIFTGSGTESIAIALLGLVYDFNFKNKNILPHIITTNIEHSAVLENCKLLEEKNEAEVTYLKVDQNGIINPKDIRDSLKENTILVSVVYANNEIGTIEPIQEIAKEIRYFKKIKKIDNKSYPFFHTDACQAMNYLYTENVEKLGIDMMSFNSSKIYGPKGIGVLYLKRGIDIYPIYKGGGQESGLRSGTEDVLSIYGFSLALEKVNKIKSKESERLIKIRDYAIDKILEISNDNFKIKLNGDLKNRLPNNINISIENISSELILIELDARGVYVSEKSACHSSNENISHVIRAIRRTCNRKNKEEGSIRISLGRYTSKKDMDYLVKCLHDIFKKYGHLKNL